MKITTLKARYNKRDVIVFVSEKIKSYDGVWGWWYTLKDSKRAYFTTVRPISGRSINNIEQYELDVFDTTEPLTKELFRSCVEDDVEYCKELQGEGKAVIKEEDVATYMIDYIYAKIKNIAKTEKVSPESIEFLQWVKMYDRTSTRNEVIAAMQEEDFLDLKKKYNGVYPKEEIKTLADKISLDILNSWYFV